MCLQQAQTALVSCCFSFCFLLCLTFAQCELKSVNVEKAALNRQLKQAQMYLDPPLFSFFLPSLPPSSSSPSPSSSCCFVVVVLFLSVSWSQSRSRRRLSLGNSSKHNQTSQNACPSCSLSLIINIFLLLFFFSLSSSLVSLCPFQCELESVKVEKVALNRQLKQAQTNLADLETRVSSLEEVVSQGPWRETDKEKRGRRRSHCSSWSFFFLTLVLVSPPWIGNSRKRKRASQNSRSKSHHLKKWSVRDREDEETRTSLPSSSYSLFLSLPLIFISACSAWVLEAIIKQA